MGWRPCSGVVVVAPIMRTRLADLNDHWLRRHHAIGDVLAENELDTLEPDLLHFLLATSVI